MNWLRYTLVVFFIGYLTHDIKSQEIGNWEKLIITHQEKLAPQLFTSLKSSSSELMEFIVSVKDNELFDKHIRAIGLEHCIQKTFSNINSYLIKIEAKQLLEEVISWNEVSFINITNRIPKPERAVREFDLGVNKVNFVQHNYPEWNGEGINISVKELSMDSMDIDFADRFIPSNNATNINVHATTMATIIAGAGNSGPAGKGVATNAGLTSTSFFNLFPETDNYYQTFDLSIQNHSYGLGIENFYGAEAAAYDSHTYREGITHVFSAGNIGDSTSTEGPYAGIPGFANLTGTFKMGKNVITLGSVDTNLVVQSRSSRGPAYDGRVKPELVALGQDGSSGAAAITSGLIALMEQAYFEQEGENLPDGLTRAILLNSADDLLTPGPDFISGYGNVNAKGAIEHIENQQYFSGTVSQGQQLSFELNIPDNVKELKITLAWIDPPAEVNADKALVNDLDLELHEGEDIPPVLPWILNSEANIESLNQTATRGYDRLNNQEQISITDPNPGMYRVEVSGVTTAGGAQNFYVAYEWKVEDRLQISYPTASDVLTANDFQYVRWLGQSSDLVEVAYKLTDATQWITIGENLDADSSLLNWFTPDITQLAQVRLRYGDKVVISDTFAISVISGINLNLACDNFIQLSWDNVPGVNDYQVYHYVENILQPFVLVKDRTSLRIERSEIASDYYAVAPVLSNNIPGFRSISLFLPFQNAGCYIRSFLTAQVEEEGELRLFLGSLEDVSNIRFQKLINGSFQDLEVQTSLSSTTLTATDQTLRIGANTYRVIVTLSNGEELVSNEDIIFFAPPNDFLIYPNPVSQANNILIAIGNPNGETIEIYDSLGKLVLKYDILGEFDSLETNNFPAGVYTYQILREGEKVKEGKIVIY